MRRRQALSLTLPFVLADPYAYGLPKALLVAALEVGGAYFCVAYRLGEQQIVLVSVSKESVGSRYVLATDEPVAQAVALLKRQGLQQGATLEAIQLLGTLTSLTREEEATMANTKLSRKDELKSAAKETPVDPKKAAKGKPAAAPKEEAAPKKKGNADALAAARAAKAKGPDTRKITVIKKDHGARAGTKRAEMLDIVLKAKTVAQAIDNGATMVDVRFAKDSGLINLA